MRKISKIVDFVARGLDPTKNWTELNPSFYSSHIKKYTLSKEEQEISPHNAAYTIPGRDYLKEDI